MKQTLKGHGINFLTLFDGFSLGIYRTYYVQIIFFFNGLVDNGCSYTVPARRTSGQSQQYSKYQRSVRYHAP
jgi:hypothetical protein